MSDQIKVLSRDVPKNLIDGWGMFKACLTYRKTRHPGYEREFYEINKQVVDWFDLLILALVDKFEEPEPKCVGYPICDGNLVGLEHDEGCPLYKPKEPEPAWEPGTVAATSYGYFRLDSKDGHYWHGVYIVTFPCSPIPRGDERLESEKSFQGIHRRPHEFKVGDWFECLSVHCHTPGPMIVRKVREASISDDGGSWHPIDACRHSPPPKEEKPSQERHKCDACGKEFDPDDLQILCAKCAKMQIESILDCALHSELPTDRAVETSEKSHPDPRKWELCGHDVLKKDCPTCSSEGPFQGPH